MSRKPQPEYTRVVVPDELDAAMWIANRLAEHGVRVDIISGLTDMSIRRDRLRKAITVAGMSMVTCDSKLRKPVTYAQAFERTYGEPLDSNIQQGRRNAKA